jgi:hypothetical protein
VQRPAKAGVVGDVRGEVERAGSIFFRTGEGGKVSTASGIEGYSGVRGCGGLYRALGWFMQGEEYEGVGELGLATFFEYS